MLEARALGEDVPDEEDMGTKVDNAAIRAAGGAAIDAFKVRLAAGAARVRNLHMPGACRSVRRLWARGSRTHAGLERGMACCHTRTAARAPCGHNRASPMSVCVHGGVYMVGRCTGQRRWSARAHCASGGSFPTRVSVI